MLIKWPREPEIETYKDFKQGTTNKYSRKIEAIISNIENNSLKAGDKIKLKKLLAKKLIDSIK